jgi:hypothetical protein
MWRIIHFRTQKSGKQIGGGSLKKVRGQGSEYDTIRPATTGDDARDIAWKQFARSEILSIKSRQDSQNINLMLLGIEDASWDFSLENHDTKKIFYNEVREWCSDTAKMYRYLYDECLFSGESLESTMKKLIGEKTQKKLILIITSSLEISEYLGLSEIGKLNDIVIIHLLHAFELNPFSYKKMLFESSVITPEYTKKLSERINAIKEVLIRQNISYISASTKDHPIDLLNQFFKHRYAR